MNKQTILITGCSHGGIGYATAEYLKEQGYRVFASVRKQEDVEKLTAEGFEAYVLDVLDDEQIDAALADILQKTGGKLDVLFNNAGYSQAGALEDIPTKHVKEQFDTNFFALHNLTCKALKVMRKQGYGKIIQHGSVLGLVSLKYRGAYNASKYAIEGLVDTMRQELRGSNIHMTILNTGPVTSKIRENSMKTVKNIEFKNSVYLSDYKKLMSGNHKPVPFNEEAIAVAKVVEKILKAKNPAPRYSITKFTSIAKLLKWMLSSRALERVLSRY